MKFDIPRKGLALITAGLLASPASALAQAEPSAAAASAAPQAAAGAGSASASTQDAIPPASAPAPVAAAGSPAASPSTNAMINLIRLLVQQGTITPANGEALARQAEAEAGKARAAAGELPAAAAGAIRVPYIPQTVRDQIRDEIKGEVMQQAKSEGWAAPNQQAPAWLGNIKLTYDVRFRSESALFSKGNADDLLDYAAINNTAGGFDFFKNVNNIPILNTTQNRMNRLRIRARLGAEFDISRFVSASIRIATGDDNSPISTNQNLGGGLAKRNIWLDQAYLKLTPTDWINANVGRFPNPFASTDLLFDRDINFDGVVVEANAKSVLPENVTLAIRAGAFPLDFGSSDFPSTKQDKKNYPSKWLFAGQIEGGYDFDNGIKVRVAAGYYNFRNVQGQLSDPCVFNGQTVSIGTNDPTECSTDGTRAFFPRKGNTLFFIRNIVVPAPDTVPASNKQYLGLVYRYAIMDLNASVTVPIGGIEATLLGDYVRNLAYKRSDECRYGVGPNGIPFTNVVSNNGNDNPCSASSPAKVKSGNQGYLVRLTVGYKKPRKWGEWNVSADYRYLQSDAVLDSLTDSDFHLGGTNTKGYTIAGTMGLLDGVALTGRWMSANEISGRPLGIDLLQFDLSAEF